MLSFIRNSAFCCANVRPSLRSSNLDKVVSDFMSDPSLPIRSRPWTISLILRSALLIELV